MNGHVKSAMLMRRREPEDNVPLDLDEIDIDWNYLLERLERLLDLGEECLEERLYGSRKTLAKRRSTPRRP